MSGCAEICLAAALTSTSATMATPTETQLWRDNVVMDCTLDCTKRKLGDCLEDHAEAEGGNTLAIDLIATSTPAAASWTTGDMIGAGSAAAVVAALVTALVMALGGGS